MEQIVKNTHLHHPLRGQTTQNPLHYFNLNQEQEMKLEPGIYIQKESMFEKALTPSDVGKLNRLVIPKQHAEKYFPVSGDGTDSIEKGLLLSFEDESGKTWRFRYSYWNSSQSYVLTKGWSRFVKEKRLDAGDIVVFERCRDVRFRFFIGCRRRNAIPENSVAAQSGDGGWAPVYYTAYPYPTVMSSINPYQPHSLHAPGGGGLGGVQNQTVGGNSKTLRLFGVNLECQSDEPVAADGSNQSDDQAHVPNHHSHMDINFSRDVNQMRFHQE